jgi:positive phototaxis protein PixI
VREFKSSVTSEQAAPPDKSYQFLGFQLTPDLQALILTAQLGEVLSLEANQVVPIFDRPAAVMGICNHRGEVLWIVDLAALLGLETLFAQDCRQSHSVMVIHQMQSHVGVAVRQVGQLVRCPATRIQPLPPTSINLPPRLAFCLNGLYQPSAQKSLLVLDGEKILDLLKAD